MLRDLVRLSGVSQRKIERSLGLSPGYLTRILEGRLELRVQHVLGICEAVGFPPGAFFLAAYPSQSRFTEETWRTLGALEKLHPEEGTVQVPGLSRADTERVVRQLLDQLIRSQGSWAAPELKRDDGKES